MAEGKIEEFSQEGFDCNFIGMVVHAGIEVGTLYIPDAEEVVVLFVVPFNAKLVERLKYNALCGCFSGLGDCD